jgi:conjugative relaxase-like TrwC/TraI family protein
MLRITQQDSAKDAKRYYASADYYSEGQEIVGSWGGEGARRLGLEGTVDKRSFDRLCDNLDPRDGKHLTVRTRSDRTVGYDFTFSVPKSVSLLYAMTDDGKILDAFRGAVDETMRDIEAEMKTRVRRGGKDTDRPTGNLAWAEFIHTTSRPVDGVPDPQLHAHCFVFNSTWDGQEGRWKAGQFRDLKRDAPFFQAAFRVRLANKLQDVGFGVERKRDDFEVSGVPGSSVRRFSRRTEEIEKVAAERGITDPRRKAELGAETREKKNHELTWGELRKEWDSRLTDSERQGLKGTHGRTVPYARPIEWERPAVDYALDHCFTRKAVVPERELLTEALKRGLGAVTVEGVRGELAGRPLIRGEKDGRAMATTQDMEAAESRLVAFARGGRGRLRPLGDPDRPITRERFNIGQKAAVRQHRSVSAGEPLRLLEERAGVPVAEVTEIVRQEEGDFRKAASALSEGRTEEGFAVLDRLGWITEIPHAGRYWALAQGYLSATLERDRKGQHKTALVVSPTHAECDRITHFIRNALHEGGRLGPDRTLDVWTPAQLTDAQKGDATNYEPGTLLQFHQHAPGVKNGARLVVTDGRELPLKYASRFEVYRPARLTVAVGDRVRVTCNGKTKDGTHRLTNGALFTVQGFTPQGDPIVDRGWVIGREFGHLAHGYAVTSHASQGKTVNKVFIGLSSQSFPAANQRSFYVPVTRGKEQAVIFTDDKKELLRAVKRTDEPLSATELAQSARRKPPRRRGLHKHLAFVHRLATFARTHEPSHSEPHRTMPSDRGRHHAR